MSLIFETLIVRKEGAVLFAEISAPRMNLQTRDGEMDLPRLVGDLADHSKGER